MKEQKEAIMPCPVCGSEDVIQILTGKEYGIKCCSCGLQTRMYGFKKLAETEWNKSMRPQFVKEDHEGRTINRAYVLDKAKDIVHGQRNEEYGTPEDNFETIGELWEAYIRRRCVSPGTDVGIHAADVANLMILMKVARLASGTATEDSYVDIAGYAACGAECEFGGAK